MDVSVDRYLVRRNLRYIDHLHIVYFASSKLYRLRSQQGMCIE
jgi:hypothetical protein